ncbi:hypothetical protein LSAT2_027815, partial [Lamellibrachia satsuma]
ALNLASAVLQFATVPWQLAVAPRKLNSGSRELVDGEWLLTKKLDIPQVHLTESPGLQYKYAILKSGKEVWEFVGKKEPSSEANRSLHLQKDDLKMLKGRVEAVKDHLQQYFDQAKQVLRQDSQQDSQQVLDLCMLFVQCLEDSYHNKASRLVESETDLLKLAKVSLTSARSNLTAEGLHVDKLEAIALTRFGLSVGATWMEKVHVQRQQCSHMKDVRQMFDAAAVLCEQDLRWPRLFLMRQLSRRFGLDSLHRVGEVRYLRWVIPREARQTENDGIPDRFVVAGENYQIIREVITRVILGEESQLIDEVLQTMPQDGTTERNLLLALYTEVKVPNTLGDTARTASTEASITTVNSLFVAAASITIVYSRIDDDDDKVENAAGTGMAASSHVSVSDYASSASLTVAACTVKHLRT